MHGQRKKSRRMNTSQDMSIHTLQLHHMDESHTVQLHHIVESHESFNESNNSFNGVKLDIGSDSINRVTSLLFALSDV